MGKDESTMENPSAFPMGEPNDGFAQYFVGQSYLAPVLESPQIAIHKYMSIVAKSTVE